MGVEEAAMLRAHGGDGMPGIAPGAPRRTNRRPSKQAHRPSAWCELAAFVLMCVHP